CSNGLASLGLARGDRLAILSFNCHRFFELYYGAPQHGVIVVPLNFRVPPREIRFILEDSGARAVVVDDAFAPLLDQAVSEVKSVRHLISSGENVPPGYISYEEMLAAAGDRYEPEGSSGHALVGLFYTSGTTGEPKGVMLSHNNIVSNIEHSSAAHKPATDDIYLHAAPMFHLADAAAVFSNTSHGITQVFIPRFEPRAVLEAIAREHVTSLLLVPTMINFLLREPDLESYDFSSLRQITYGASPIAPETLRRAMAVLGCRFLQGYGLTEAAPLLTVLLAEEHDLSNAKTARRLASCGRPAPGVEVRVVKDDGTETRPGEAGEIIARGDNVMVGYWQRPEETASVVRDGWLYTGDLATVDEDGYIYLVDRKKDMIVTGGENVFSTEVEAVLYEHPAVREAAVIPVPDADWGEAVHACLTLAAGQTVTPAELIEFCRSRLAKYKVPRTIEILEGELPKGGSGKILKKELRERYWRDRSRRIG
ncbi:MAG TPA: long-chain-fatty-acid--CoA ligase, partial [Blastocatellia bacterium]|nr:long-chain-fatty-acid--CoA ligase [Blastocatellia bacterium]